MLKSSLFVIRYRRWILIISAIILIGTIIPLFQLKINPDLESYMPDSMTSKTNNRKISEIFGNDETILIIIESKDVLNPTTLARIRDISNSFLQRPEFKQVLSLFQTKSIESAEGMMVVNPVIDQIPEDPVSREKLRQSILKNDLASGLVVSEDFRYAMIMLSSDKQLQDKELMALIHQIINQFPGEEKTYITGQPFLREEANQKIGRDIMILLPIGLLVMLIFLWLSFREIKAVLMPFSVVIFSILLAMALIPLFNWELSLIGVLIPIMMIAIANNYGVHVVAKYQELAALHPERSQTKIIQQVIEYLRKPVILCGLTTIVGTLGLVVHLLIPASQMGVISAIAIGFALLLSLTLIPAVMSMMKRTKVIPGQSHIHRGVFHYFLKKTGEFVALHPRLNIIFFSIFFLLMTAGILRMHVAPDSNKVLPETHEFNKAIGIANGHFGGSKMINIMFSGDATDPALLKRMEGYSLALEKNPDVGRTASLSTMIKKMSMALNDPGDSAYNRIPDSPEAIAQYLELYAMSADIADFERFLSFDYGHTLFTIQYQADNLQAMNNILVSIDELLKDEPNIYVIGGNSLIDKELSESVETGQYYSLLFAFIAILILLSIIFKSFVAGITGSIPLVFAVFCTFGLMGWLGIELNIVTALLSSISIGLGVDFTIHVFWRLKSELMHQSDWKKAIKATITGTGRGISINAFSVILGFSVLFLSAFPLIQSFAFLIIISLLLCLISALIFIPACCLVFKPKFLLNNSKK